MKCPKCGATTREGATFCNQCGASLEPAGEQAAAESSVKPKWLRRVLELKWIIAVYLVVSVVCMACACLLGFRTQWILWTLGLR